MPISLNGSGTFTVNGDNNGQPYTLDDLFAVNNADGRLTRFDLGGKFQYAAFNNFSIRVNGWFVIDTTLVLLQGVNDNDGTIVCNNNGRLDIGRLYTGVNQVGQYARPDLVIDDRHNAGSSSTANDAYACVRWNNGATGIWQGADIDCFRTVSLMEGSSVQVRNARMLGKLNSSKPGRGPQFRQRSVNTVVNGLELYGVEWKAVTPCAINGLRLVDSIIATSGTGGAYLDHTITGLSGENSPYLVSIGDDQLFNLIDTPDYKNALFRKHSDQHTGRILQFISQKFVVREGLNPLDDVLIHLRDSNSGQRPGSAFSPQADNTYDFSQDTVYQLSTGGNGEVNQDLLVSTFVPIPSEPEQTIRTSELRTPYTFVAAKYGYLFRSQDTFEPAIGVDYQIILNADPFVTLAESDVSSLSSIVYDPATNTLIISESLTDEQIYCWASYYKASVAGCEFPVPAKPIISTLNGRTYQLHCNLQIIGSFTEVSFDGLLEVEGDVDIDESLFVGDIQATGTVSFINGGSSTGSVLDAAGDTQVRVFVPEGYDHAISIHTSLGDAQNKSNAISSGNVFRFMNNLYAGTTFWYRLEQADGSFIIENYEVPTSPGSYDVTLVVSENSVLFSRILNNLTDIRQGVNYTSSRIEEIAQNSIT